MIFEIPFISHAMKIMKGFRYRRAAKGLHGVLFFVVHDAQGSDTIQHVAEGELDEIGNGQVLSGRRTHTSLCSVTKKHVRWDVSRRDSHKQDCVHHTPARRRAETLQRPPILSLSARSAVSTLYESWHPRGKCQIPPRQCAFATTDIVSSEYDGPLCDHMVEARGKTK